MMKSSNKWLVVFLCVFLLPLSSFAGGGIVEVVLRGAFRTQPSQFSQLIRRMTQQLPGHADRLVPLFDINNQQAVEDETPLRYPNEHLQGDGFMRFLPECFYGFSYVEFPNGSRDLEEGTPMGDGLHGEEDQQPDVRQLGHTVGIVETVTFLQTGNGYTVNLDAVPGVLAEGRPEAQMAEVIDRAIRRAGLVNNNGEVPYQDYRDFIELVRSNPLPYVDGTEGFFDEDVD